jgi:cold shock CspA family protein/ribosome-associated translation inhibitor RaiA
MQTPVEVSFRDMTATPEIRASIAEHVAQLERRFGRVTACRVELKGPGAHHRTQGLYEVTIRLALPDGREVNIGRTPPADERYGDLNFALNNAFKRARRRLQDHVRRLQGQVKQHEGQPIGTVVRLDPSGEFGFLESSERQEIYFHRNSALNDGFRHLAVGSRVTFTEEIGEKGPQASTVKQVEHHKLRP